MPKPPKSVSGPAVLLVDNGSLEPASTLSLRTLADRLTDASGHAVKPVSLLHSSTVDPSLLNGQPAEILEPCLRQFAESGQKDVVIVPLFFGPSAALTDYLPERVHYLQKTWPDLRIRLAPCLVNTAQPQDNRITKILVERIRESAARAHFTHPAVAVVDHGTPQRAVNAVRELVVAQTKVLLGKFARVVTACSMERRPGPEHDFNEPLLESLLETKDLSSGEIVVAQLFLQPGRHAGPGGDIAQICHAAATRHPEVKIAIMAPLGSHADLIPILAERLEQGLCSVEIK